MVTPGNALQGFARFKSGKRGDVFGDDDVLSNHGVAASGSAPVQDFGGSR